MKTNFLNLVAKMPQNTGGGSSQRFTLRSIGAQYFARFLGSSCRIWKYVACMLMVLFMGVGNVWADETYYLQKTDKASGSSPELTGDFYTTAPLSFSVNQAYSEVTYKKGLTLSTNMTSMGSNMKKPDALVRYDCKTNNTEITVVVWNKHGSNSKKLYRYTVQENATIGSANTVSSYDNDGIDKNSLIAKTYTVKKDTRTSIYFAIEDRSNQSIVQIIAVEKGTKFPNPGEVGYQINFNQMRYVAPSGSVGTLDSTSTICGIEMCMNDDGLYSKTAGKLGTNNTNYIKFKVATPVKLNFTTSSTKKYTVSKTKGSTADQITPTANKAEVINLTTAGTYYINPQESSVQPTGLSFSAAPKVTYNANTGGGSMDPSYFTVVANGFTAPSGKMFKEWRTNADGTGTKYDEDDEIESDVTLFAIWEDAVTKYAVTKGTHANGDFTISPVEQKEGGKVTLAATPEDGYIFSSWSIVKTEGGSATGISVDANSQFVMPAYDVTVNATFILDPCSAWGYGTTVTSVPSSGNSQVSGSLTVANVGCDVQTGAVCVGSSTSTKSIKANGSSKYVTASLGGTPIASIEFSLYTGSTDAASKKAYVVAYCSESTFNTSKLIQISEGNYGEVRNTNATSSSTQEIVEIDCPAGTKSVAIGRNISGVTTVAEQGSSDARYVYYLRACPAASHAVTYALNGATGTTPTQADVAEGAKFTLHNGTTGITAPANKKFDGWYDGTTKYAGGAEYTMGGDDVELTAQWADAYAVTYVPNNGVLPAETMTDSNSPYLKDAEVTLLANAFTAPDGKEFDAWVVTKTAGGEAVAVTDGKFTMPAEAVTVTATWKSACALAPTVSATTLGTTSYTTQVVNCAGISVLGSAGCTISEYGFVYGTTTEPTISDNKKALTGDYTVINTAFAETTLTGLAANTKYYVRAYATNSFGTAYGDESSFTTLTLLGNVLVIAGSADHTSDAITAMRNAGFVVIVSAPNDSRDYTGFDLVVLDESLDGSLAQTSTSEASTIKGANIPILNLKAFFYTKTNRWNWGSPVNGTAKNEIANIPTIYCNAQSHPIFTGLTIGAGGAIDLIDPAVASGNTLQGVTTNTLVEGKEGYTLATSGDGITFIHELTPDQRGVTDAKYLMVAISNNAKDNLSADGEKLIVNAAKYLIGSATWEPVLAPATEGIVASPAASYSEGDNISLSIIATNVDAATTYTWYKGATLTAAKEAGAIQAAKTIAESGNVYAKASCLAEDAGTYWCVITAGCEISASLDVTVLTCTKPGTPANLAASDEAFTTADLSWDAAANADGYKISIIKKEGEDVILDWTDNATTSYAATGLTQGTEYTFKVKAKGATGYCEYGLEATVDFTTTTPSVADLVTIADDYAKTFTETIGTGALYDENRFINQGSDECNYSSGDNGIRIKTNRALAFKVAANAKVKVTFKTSGERKMQLGSALSAGNYDTYGSSATSPFTFTVAEGGVVYLTATDQLYISKLEIMYPHSVTYDLNGGTGTLPTQEAKYVGETFTAHNGTTGITPPIGKEFSKWKDQDEADVLGGATYTMPAKAVTLTAQWIDPPTRYTVSFDLQGHGSAITSQSVADGEKAVKPADPSESGWEFEGWYTDADCTAGNEFDFNTAIIADRPLFAKWSEFDACAVLTPATSGETIGVGAAISLQAGSVGGMMEAVVKSGSTSTTLAYTENGLAFNSSGDQARVKVTLSHKLQKGSIIRVTLKANGANNNDRGLEIYNEAGTKKGFLGFTQNEFENGDVAKFSYVVTEDDGLKDTKVFYLYRKNSVFMADLKVANCAPQDFTVTYKDGETTLGTEDVFENAHPTAAGIVTRKGGYIFQGWAETKGGDVVDLDDITITAAKTLYAKYTARDCSGIGTKYKFQLKTDLTSGNMFATAPVPATAMTTENYLSEIVGGELEVSNTNNNNNRVVISDQKAIGFSGGDGGKLTLYLNCPLQENDEIRFINYASSGNSITLSDGTNNTTLNGNGTETVQTFTIPEAWETTGSYVLTMVRGNSTAKLTYFEIYRRPVLTDVTLNDLTIRTGQALAPQMTLTPIEGMVTSQEWEITDRTGATGATINPSTGVVTAGTETGTLTVQVTVNGTFVRTCTVTIINIYTSLVPVTGTTSWNWAGSATGEPTIDDVENRGTILANYINGANFEKLEGKAGEYAYRSSTYPCYQGTQLHFVTTVPGMLKINARNSASGQRISVNSHEVTTSDLTSTVTEYSIVVPAGDVMITSNATNVRIYSMNFDTKLENYEITDNVLNGYTRDVNPQYYGTICLPKAGVIVGATLFELAYMDYKGDNPYKVYYDEIINGELEAGMPYIFLAHESTIGVFYTDDAEETDAKKKNGLHGTLVDIPSGMNGTNVYMLYNNQVLHSTNPGSYLNANRAYIQLNEVPGYNNPGYHAAPAKPGRRRISTGFNAPQIATGLEDAAANETPVKVLINGELYILRGEKMYDATGRLVK